MKKFTGIYKTLIVALLFTSAFLFSSFAKEENKKTGFDMNALETSKENTHIVLIVGNKEDKTKVNVYDYTKSPEGVWSENWSVGGICGKTGISEEKKEGDKKTPEGKFSATMNFGIKKDPGSILPYHKVKKGDFWVDDSESKFYNKLVNTSTTKKEWNSAENMIRQAPYYNYGIVLDYNKDCVPYKGSAVFIHCTKTDKDTYSAGCIRISEEYMKKLISGIDKDTKIIIVSDEDKLKNY